MAFENVDMEDVNGSEAGSPPPEESSNKTFIIVAGILGLIMILTLICIVVFAMVYLPKTQSASKTAAADRIKQNTQVALANAQNTVVAEGVKMTEAAAKLTPTPTKPLAVTATATATKAPTNTQVVAKPATNTPVGASIDPRTPTAAALLTQAAIAQKTFVPTLTPTGGLPKSGFADEVGMPVLLGAAALLVVIIFMARRLRTAH